MKVWFLVSACLAFGCGPEEEPCLHEGDYIDPDYSIGETRAGDLLEPYFGKYEGVLEWTNGERTGVSFDIRYEAGDPYRVTNVSRCKRATVYYWAPTLVRTDDGAFDNEVGVALSRREPPLPPDREPIQLSDFEGIPSWTWPLAMFERLPVDENRYQNPSLHFELEWRLEDTDGPTSGVLTLGGALAASPELSDSVTVGTVEF